jgi:hypothetical protein
MWFCPECDCSTTTVPSLVRRFYVGLLRLSKRKKVVVAALVGVYVLGARPSVVWREELTDEPVRFPDVIHQSILPQPTTRTLEIAGGRTVTIEVPAIPPTVEKGLCFYAFRERRTFGLYLGTLKIRFVSLSYAGTYVTETMPASIQAGATYEDESTATVHPGMWTISGFGIVQSVPDILDVSTDHAFRRCG